MSDGPAFPNGLRVTVAGRLGTVRFCGGTTFAAGVWVGVELDDAVGKNSGTVQDVEYFRCPPEHGIFVRPPMVQALEGDAARPSVLSRGGEAPSRASVASASTSGASEQAKAAASVAASAAAPAPTLAADTAHEKKQEGAKPEDAAAKKAAAEKTAAEKAAADKVAAEKAAADKVAAEKAAAEKVAAEKAAAEKVAAEKAAAEKAAAEKDAADKAAADKAAANKAAADKAAADKAAADKAAAEKAAAAAEQAEKAARDQAKRAQEASAEQLAASKAQASAEADLRGARQEVTRLKNDIERARASISTERERLSQLKWRREQALQKMEKLAKMDYGVIEQSEEVQQAQAEMKRAAEAAEKLRSELNQKKNNVSTMMMIRSKLKKKVGDVQDQSQLQGVLQEKLEAAVLARLLAEERLEELRLELAEAELKRDEEAQERFRLLVQIAAAPTPSHEPQGEDSAMAALMKLQNRKNRNDTPAAPAEVEETPAQKVAAITRSPNLDAYQEALRVLHDASQHEVSQLQKQIAELDQDSNKVPRLKNDQKALTNRQNLLQERMADLDTETLALAETAKAGEELLDLRDSVVHELRQEVERREERLGKLEDLVLKLDKDRRRLMEEAERDALDAKQLREEVVRLMDGNLQGERTSAEQVHSRLAVATVQRSLARLDLATAQAKANAFADCVPKTWVVEEATGPAATLSLALARGTCAQAAEGLLFRLEVLGRRSAQESHRPPCRLELCEVASASFRTAAALASALDGGLCEASVEAAKALEAQFRRVEPKLKEVMSRKTLDSPSQVLSCLQDLEALTQQLPKSQSRRVVGLQLQRFQVAFAYGAASASEPVTAGESTTPVELAKEAPEDSAMAALMRLQNRKKKKEEEPTMPSADADAADVENSATETAQAAESAAGVPVEVEQFHEEQWAELAQRLQVLQHAVEPKNWPGGPELQRIGKAIEVGLSRCSTGGEEPLSFWRALKTASEFWETLLPSLEKRAPLAKGAEELSLSSARVSATLPAWADSSLEVQSRIEEIDEKQREVRDANQRLKEKQKELALAEEEMQKAEGRARDLKTQLSAMLQANQTSEALQAEEEELRQTVALKAKQQANLAQQLHEAKAKRDHLEELHQDEEKKRAKLEESIDKMRQRPKQDEDGRATAPELAALRLAQKKGARELYRLQVAGMEELLPFPSQKETSHKDEALEKYILLRKSLLKHLSGTRIHRLGVHHTDAEASLRVQELHLQWSEARSTQKLDAEVKSGSPHGGAAGLGAEKVLKMSLTLQSPRWASTKVEKDLHTSSWSEIREIHQATNPVLSASK